MNRAEAIEWLKDIKESEIEALSDWSYDVAIDIAIEALQDDWIPVSERLPDDLAEVNVTWVNHDPEPYYDFVKDKPASASAVFYKGKWFWYSSVCADILAEYGKNDTDEVDNAIEILAWMPLPKPYREDGEA